MSDDYTNESVLSLRGRWQVGVFWNNSTETWYDPRSILNVFHCCCGIQSLHTDLGHMESRIYVLIRCPRLRDLIFQSSFAARTLGPIRFPKSSRRQKPYGEGVHPARVSNVSEFINWRDLPLDLPRTWPCPLPSQTSSLRWIQHFWLDQRTPCPFRITKVGKERRRQRPERWMPFSVSTPPSW